MRERRKSDAAFECRFLVRESKTAHERDVKNNAEPDEVFFKKPRDSRSAKARAFERKWLGG